MVCHLVQKPENLSDTDLKLTSSWFMRDRRALFILDDAKTLRLMNRVAGELIEAGDFFRLEKSQLRIVPDNQNQKFRLAVDRSLAEGVREWGLFRRACDGSGIGVYTIEPIKEEVDGRHSLLISYAPALTVNTHLDTVLQEFGLTHAEREIAYALIDQLSLADIAEHRGVKPSTIKSHVTSIYEKTGTRGRIQFISQFTLLASLGL